MRPLLLPSVVVMAVAALAAGAQDQSPSFTASSSELVVLPVSVVEKRGGVFVTSLGRDRFTVFDNGRPAEISLFTNEDTPVTIGLVIDNSGSMAPKMPEVIVGATAFARSSNPQDELFTMAFNDRVVDAGNHRIQTANDSSAIETALREMRPHGQTALYDALIAALDRVEHTTQPRKALVVMSDGGDNASEATLNDVLERARRSNVTIYAIGLFDADDPDRNPGVLKSLAESTGGERFLPRSPSLLLEAFTRIAQELRSGYTIGFVPPARDGAFHRVRVEVAPDKGARISVRTRPGYFASAPRS